MSDDENFDHNDDGDVGGGTETGVTALNVQQCDLGDCKELSQPNPIGATLCRRNVYVILKECPCKINDLKVSKTGKHGSAKCNMVGYDIITGKKYQQTEPGHASMMTFTPVKMEYEVADISGRTITAMTADGQEKQFDVPETDVGRKLCEEFAANSKAGGDKFWIITVLYAPRQHGNSWKANILVESYKPGKAD